MGFKPGQDVIVVHDNKNQVGVVLEKHVISKQVVYDVLLENRSALIYVSTVSSSKTRIDKYLTSLLCETGAVVSTIPYKEMLVNEELPICHA